MKAGCDDYLRKPFRSIEFFDAIRKHLGVEFVYKDCRKHERQTATETGDESRDSGATFKAAHENLTGISPKMDEKLRKAVKYLDFDMAVDVVEQMRKAGNTGSEKLAELVEAYRFDKIENLLNETKDKRGDSLE